MDTDDKALTSTVLDMVGLTSDQLPMCVLLVDNGRQEVERVFTPEFKGVIENLRKFISVGSGGRLKVHISYL